MQEYIRFCVECHKPLDEDEEDDVCLECQESLEFVVDQIKELDFND